MKRSCPACSMRISISDKYCFYCHAPIPLYSPTKIELLLDEWDNISPSQIFTNKLVLEIAKNWELIKSRQLITWYLIDTIYMIRDNNEANSYLHRINHDNRTGGIFEDKVGHLLRCYLEADDIFWKNPQKCAVQIKINSSLNIPGENRARHPDIAIFLNDERIPRLILELKVSYTHRSIKRYFQTMEEMYRRLSPTLDYSILIFSVSELKSKLFKQSVPCNILCSDFQPNRTSQEKQVYPKIKDPLELLFEQIKVKILKI